MSSVAPNGCRLINGLKCLLLGLPLAWLAGCTSLPAPSTSLVNVQFTQATLFETSGQFTLRLSNERPDPIVLKGGVFKIYFNDVYVGKALSHEELQIGGLDSTTTQVTVRLDNLAMATRVKPIIESRRFQYRIVSTLYGKSPSGRMSSTSEGALDLRDFTPTTPPSPVGCIPLPGARGPG